VLAFDGFGLKVEVEEEVEEEAGGGGAPATHGKGLWGREEGVWGGGGKGLRDRSVGRW